MKKTYILADTHFGHESLYSKDGTRFSFSNAEDFDEFYITHHNNIVNKNDRVIIVGDVGSSKEVLDNILPKLNGKLELVLGNHDKFSSQYYLQYFEEVYGCLIIEDFIITHIPIHQHSKGKYKRNLHGHLHQVLVGNQVPDFFYRNVCLDANDYTPIDLDIIRDETSKIIQLEGSERIII